MKRVVLLIDGGHLRVLAKNAGHDFNPDFIERLSRLCIDGDEELLRVLYYDCAPFSGPVRLPVSGAKKVYRGDDSWLKDLAARDLFAVRLNRKSPRCRDAASPMTTSSPITSRRASTCGSDSTLRPLHPISRWSGYCFFRVTPIAFRP
jgi:hypothetical protein